MTKKNSFRKLSPAVEVKGVQVPICNFKSIFIGPEAQVYKTYMLHAHEAFTEKYPMVPGHENMEEYKKFIKLATNGK